ncbi:MAG: maleylpyruvate isomerase N-terminal domain-containing protein [Actinoallomurus sp.]
MPLPALARSGCSRWSRRGTRRAAAGRPDRSGTYGSGCPGWTIADLVTHLGSVYRWVGLIVGERRNERPSPQERAALDCAERRDQALLAALAMAHAQVVEVLWSAPADLDCWSMWPAANSRHYWIRRQAHETLVHRVDVQNAASGETAACADVDGPVAARL